MIATLFFLLALISVEVVHEFGHAAVARALGFKIYDISLGFGRQVVKFSLLGLPVTLRLFPLGGMTRFASPTDRFFRARLALITVAGPLTHLVVLALMCFVFGWARIADSAAKLVLGELPALAIFLFAHAEGLIFNLIPFKVTHGIGVLRSDGYILATMLFARDKHLDKYRASYLEYEGKSLLDAGRRTEALDWFERAVRLSPDSVSAVLGLFQTHLGLKQNSEARELLVALLEQKTAKGKVRNLAMNDVAWIDAISDDPSLLGEADRYSKEAYSNEPKNRFYIGTRGAVLVCLGRVDEGIEMLEKAYRRHKTKSVQGAVAYFLAIGEARNGNVVNAEEWLSIAVRDCRDDRLSRRVRAEIKNAAEEPAVV